MSRPGRVVAERWCGMRVHKPSTRVFPRSVTIVGCNIGAWGCQPSSRACHQMLAVNMLQAALLQAAPLRCAAGCGGGKRPLLRRIPGEFVRQSVGGGSDAAVQAAWLRLLHTPSAQQGGLHSLRRLCMPTSLQGRRGPLPAERQPAGDGRSLGQGRACSVHTPARQLRGGPTSGECWLMERRGRH